MKIWLFRFIAFSIPIVFFAIIEIALRLGGYGQSYPLFIPNPAATDYVLPRPDLVKRYFPSTANVPTVSIEANFFRTEKPQNGLRIFVQGGSTAAGFPYGLGASLAGMLDHRIKLSAPGNYVEVVNTALAAVNSYTNLDTVNEIIAQQPDAVLIYMGHNEYLGILGVGSNYTAANSRATTLLFLKLKDFRIFQWLQNVYTQLVTGSSQDNPKHSITTGNNSRTFMAKVAKHKRIELGSTIFEQGVEQFTGNLSLILRRYQDAGIPVFIGTLTSNVLNQSPFASEEIPASLSASLVTLQQHVKRQSINTQLMTQVSHELSASTNANAHFMFANLLREIGNFSDAKRHYQLAKDLDLLRFRAPEKFNQIIRNTAVKYDANVVEIQKRFEQRSHHQLVGKSLMLEHLHPNVQGYFLLADEFYQALLRHPFASDWHNIPTAQAWKNRLLLPSEEYLGFAKVAQLMADYPFVESPTEVKLPKPADWQQQIGQDVFLKKRDWFNMVQRANIKYQQDKNLTMQLKTQLMLADALPHDHRYNLQAAELLIKQGDKVRAKTYLQRVSWQRPNSSKVRFLEKQLSP